MKMKKISILLTLFLLASVVSAQGTVYEKNKSSDNWFISLAGGTNMYFGSGSTDATFKDAEMIINSIYSYVTPDYVPIVTFKV